MTSKQRLLATVRGQRRDRVAVTPLFMQWAAKFIGVSFRDYYLRGDVLAKAQIATAQALATDHVTVMGEPWTEADSYGMQFDYPESGAGIPKGWLLQKCEDITKLPALEPHAMPRLQERLRCIQKEVQEVGQTHCVVGWVEGPIAEYADLRGVQDTMLDLMDQPKMFHKAAEVLVHNAIVFGKAQARAGADIVGVGDAAASLVGPEIYQEHIWPWEKKLIKGLHDAGVLVKLHICGNINAILKPVSQTGADIIDCDWMVNLAKARQIVGPEVTLAGNFDPSAVLLQGGPLQVAAAARRCIAEGGERFILQPGCEVPPGTSLANLKAFCPGEGCLIDDALSVA